MAHVTLPEVQQWLEATKLTLSSLDPALEDSAFTVVSSMLDRRYDTTVWVDSTTTPSLIRKIISLLIASWTYERQYSEESTGSSSYSTALEDSAMSLIAGLTEGSIDIVGVVPTNETSQQPAFLPTDDTGLTQRVDGLGFYLGVPGDEDIKFTMGRVF